MGKIKIVRIIARLNIGGPAVNASILSSSLDRDRFDTKVVYGSLAEGEGSLEDLMRRDGVDMELVPELGRDISPLDDLKAFFKIAGILRREKPDIVHTHTAKAGTLGRLAAIFAGVRIRVHTFHGNVFRGYFGRTRTRVFIWIERALGSFTTKVVTVSAGQRDELVREFRIVPAGKCIVVPLGVDVSRLRGVQDAPADLRRELGLGDRLVVGILGRLVPIKDHAMFLQAASRIRRERPDIKVKYLIVGDGELRGELETMAASLGIGDSVAFLGWRRDLGSLYRAIDIVALTSKNEGTPLALIEAMAMGRPVIATNVGGVSDIVDDGVTGLLVEPGDAGHFADGLKRLLEDRELRERMGASGAEKSHLFSKENLVGRMTELYTDCLADNRKDGR